MITKSFLNKRFIPICLFLVALTLIISRIMYPPDGEEIYSDIWDTISGLGNMDDNPTGWIFFQIAMLLSGIVIIPVALFVRPKMMEIQKGNGIIGTFFLFMGAIGFILTGAIPDGLLDVHKLHEITAGLGFGGVMFAAFFFFWPSKKASEQDIDKKILKIITVMWWIPLIIAGIAYGYAEIVIKPEFNLGWYGIKWGEAGVSGFYSFAVWERILYIVMFLYLWLLPNSIKH